MGKTLGMGDEIGLAMGRIASHHQQVLNAQTLIILQDGIDIVRGQAVTGKIGDDLNFLVINKFINQEAGATPGRASGPEGYADKIRFQIIHLVNDPLQVYPPLPECERDKIQMRWWGFSFSRFV